MKTKRRLSLNLAAHPSRNRRLFFVLFSLLGIAFLLVAVIGSYTYLHYKSKGRDVRSSIEESEQQINEGDIISYKTLLGTFIHRVIEKGTDQNGTYFLVQGDNNLLQDPFKVRFNDIHGVVVAVIY